MSYLLRHTNLNSRDHLNTSSLMLALEKYKKISLSVEQWNYLFSNSDIDIIEHNFAWCEKILDSFNFYKSVKAQ